MYTLPAGVSIVKTGYNGALSSGSRGLILLSNNVLLDITGSSVTTTYTNVTDFDSNYTAYAFLQNGSVSSVGKPNLTFPTSGGSIGHTT